MAANETTGTVRTGQSDSRAVSLVGLLALSLSWAAGVLRVELLPQLMPDRLPVFQGQALVFALLGAISGLIAVVMRAGWPRGRELWLAVAIGLGLFVVPAGLVSFAAGGVSDYGRVVLFTLVPVFAVVFEPYLGPCLGPCLGPYLGRDGGSRHGASLPAALLGVVGALFVFPSEIPDSVRVGAGFLALILAAACVAAANCQAAVFATEFPSRSVFPMAAIAGGSSAVIFAAASAVVEQPVWGWQRIGPELLWSALVELPGLLLLFWLMRRMSAVPMTTRYLLAPLLSVLIGAFAMQAQLQPRTWLGLLLMAASAGYLLVARGGNSDEEALSLRQ